VPQRSNGDDVMVMSLSAVRLEGGGGGGFRCASQQSATTTFPSTSLPTIVARPSLGGAVHTPGTNIVLAAVANSVAAVATWHQHSGRPCQRTRL
jgi:hypothetical protein